MGKTKKNIEECKRRRRQKFRTSWILFEGATQLEFIVQTLIWKTPSIECISSSLTIVDELVPSALCILITNKCFNVSFYIPWMRLFGCAQKKWEFPSNFQDCVSHAYNWSRRQIWRMIPIMLPNTLKRSKWSTFYGLSIYEQIQNPSRNTSYVFFFNSRKVIIQLKLNELVF